MISAIGIKKILFADPSVITTDLKTAEAVKTIIKAAITKKDEILNVHEDTWNIEETEANVQGHKNQLNGKTYRHTTTPGELSVSFSVGQYDYATKAALIGGEVIKHQTKNIGWKRSMDMFNVHKALFCLTEDDVWFIFPNCQIVGRESNVDKAIAIAVKGLVQESKTDGVASEYNFDEAEVGALKG